VRVSPRLRPADAAAAVVLINVLGFYEPLRALVQGAIGAGFIQARSEGIIVFVDGPTEHAQHAAFDWGAAALAALEGWGGAPAGFFRWAEPAPATAMTLEQS
jgi:hypothetical protein